MQERLESNIISVDEMTEALERAGNEVNARLALRKNAQEGNRFNLPRSTTLPMLVAMNRLGKHIYPGTVGPVEVRKRRERNRVARRQRRVNRLGNFRKGVR